MDPEQYIITRKRKKYRFALFANSSLCFELSEWSHRPVDVVEIGAGTGLFSVELAIRHPELFFLAIDVKGDRLQKGARKAEELGLENVLFLRARADQLSEIVAPHSLSSIWITFPDPYPKKRASSRRLTHPNFLEIYRDALKEEGVIHLKHDNLDFFCWSLEQIVSCAIVIKELSFDVHDDANVSVDAKTRTTYEQRWLGEERKINYMRGEV